MSDSQQLQETDVSIPLPDGYECTVQLNRCSVSIEDMSIHRGRRV